MIGNVLLSLPLLRNLDLLYSKIEADNIEYGAGLTAPLPDVINMSDLTSIKIFGLHSELINRLRCKELKRLAGYKNYKGDKTNQGSWHVEEKEPINLRAFLLSCAQTLESCVVECPFILKCRNETDSDRLNMISLTKLSLHYREFQPAAVAMLLSTTPALEELSITTNWCSTSGLLHALSATVPSSLTSLTCHHIGRIYYHVDDLKSKWAASDVQLFMMIFRRLKELKIVDLIPKVGSGNDGDDDDDDDDSDEDEDDPYAISKLIRDEAVESIPHMQNETCCILWHL